MSFPPGTPGPDEPGQQPSDYQPSAYQPSAYPPTQPAGGWPGYAGGPTPVGGPPPPGQPAPFSGAAPYGGPAPFGGPAPYGGPAPLAPLGPAAVAPSGEPVLVSIGDITVTPTRVYTPSGSRQLAEVQWQVTDLTISSQEIPTWAIVCAVVFFLLCFLGLLFLLVKETKTQGSVQVSVSAPGFAHTTQIPVSGLAQVADINARVNYARTLAGAAPAAGMDQLPPGPGLPGPGPGLPGPGQAPGAQAPGQPWPGQGM